MHWRFDWGHHGGCSHGLKICELLVYWKRDFFFDVLCFSGLVPNIITPSLMGACNPWTPNTMQQKDWRRLFSREWCRPIICLIICPPLVIRGSAMWHSITLMSDMHTDDIVLLPVPPATLQRWCPALPFLIAMKLDGSTWERLTKLPFISNFKASIIHLWYH